MAENNNNGTNSAPEKGGFKVTAVDGKVSVTVDEMGDWAKVTITTPQFGGHAATLDDAIKELNKAGVNTNIDEEGLRRYVEYPPADGTPFLAAESTPAEDGFDGSISYNFEPKNEFKPTIDEETGLVNYKELGRIRNVQKGTLIATIKPNTNGVPGVTVKGAPINPIPGKPAKFAIGAGTVISNDQTKIYAADDGNLRWEKDRFVVDTTVTINDWIDAGIGNIDFVGDVVIKGGVMEGYRVKGKNVTIKENVTNATVEATQSIELKSGAVYSKLSCDGEIKMSFAENCTIYCKGDLNSKSLVNCNVLCEGEVSVQGGKGVIVGGECICYHNITASLVGSESYTKTVINLGNTAVLMKSHKELNDNYTTLNTNYKKLKNLYEKLNELKSVQPLTEQQEHARKQAFLFVMNEKNTLADMAVKIDQNERILAKSKLLHLGVKNKCFPNVTIKLYNAIYDNKVETGQVTFYLDSDNEIKFRAGVK
ncbi:MAG: FapA family protein [Firmicutes bacterium]|nr:FapA family protein [[Eubacterium] siraeum]MCM1487615.1 FapA family protein [Bacillota bacterium]